MSYTLGAFHHFGDDLIPIYQVRGARSHAVAMKQEWEGLGMRLVLLLLRMQKLAYTYIYIYIGNAI